MPGVARGSSASRSHLFSTSSMGLPEAPSWFSTSSTTCRCSAQCSLEASDTMTIRSAYSASSRVDLKASTSWCGSFRMKPTVSTSRHSRRSGSSTLRMTGSSVANSLSSTSTLAPDRAFSRVDLPALV